MCVRERKTERGRESEKVKEGLTLCSSSSMLTLRLGLEVAGVCNGSRSGYGMGFY